MKMLVNIFVLLLCGLSVFARSKISSDYYKLSDDLLTGYDPYVKPNHGEAIEVRFGIAMISLTIDEANSVLETNLWLRMVSLNFIFIKILLNFRYGTMSV